MKNDMANKMRGVVMSCSVALLLAACGGEAPVAVTQGVHEVAPLWMAELDLPGCSCDSMPAGSVRALLHPDDSGLVVATSSSGEPRCIDTEQLVRRLATTLGINFQGSLLSEETPAGDDPLPIGQGEQGSKDREENESAGGGGAQPPGSEQMIASGTGSDDPLPIGVTQYKKPLSSHPVRY